jgi:hypothetical protein
MGFFDKLFKPTSRPQDDKQATPMPSKTLREPARPGRNSTACPHCGAVFSSPPQRKKKCPDCKHDVYVRSKQNIFDSNLLTKEDADTADFYDQLVNLGATVGDYRNTAKELQERWGFRPNSYDVAWSVSNHLVTKFAKPGVDKSSVLMKAEFVAYAQAQYQLRRGHDPASYLRTAYNYKLQQLLNSDLRILRLKNVVIATNSCCEPCSRYEGKKYKPEQLTAEPALPIEGCTHMLNKDDKFAWCLCYYVAEYER